MTGQDIDYEALARQYGAISSMPATVITGKNGEIDYEALARQHGAIGYTPAPQPATPQPEGFWHSLGAVFNYTPEAYKEAQQRTANMTPVQEAITATTPHPIEALKSAATAVAHEFHKGSEEGKQAFESLQQGDIAGVAGHTIGQIGHAGATLTAPTMGELPSKAAEQFGAGNVCGGFGTTTGLIAPVAVAGMIKGKTPAPAGEVTPSHVEALTGLIEDRGGTVDPHETATAALPTLRETAVREGINPSKLKGREAGQATLKIAEQAVRDTQNEFNQIRKPYNSVMVDRSAMARVYRDAITPDLLENEPKVAKSLEKQAQKFDQPAPLEQVNQFRVRMNNRLDAFERQGASQQLMDDVQTRADAAAADAARDLEYDTVGKLSGLDPDYVRGLKQREGSLIETKRSLTKEYNKASGQQGEAVSEGLREKVTSTFPSKHGATKSVIKNVFGPKPIEVLNSRIQKMFADMGAAPELPEYEQQVQPPEAPQAVGGPSGPVPAGEDAIEEARRGGPGVQPPVAPNTAQTFIRGGKMGTPQGIADQVTAAKTGGTAETTARVEQHKVVKKAIGEGVQPPVAPQTPAEAVRERMANLPSRLPGESLTDWAERTGRQADELEAHGLGVTLNEPTDVIYNRAKNLVALSKAERRTPVQPPVAPTVAAGQITPEHVASENAFYTQARAELGADASPSAVMLRAQALKIEHAAKGAAPPTTPVPPTVRPTLTQRVQTQPLPKLRRVQPPVGGNATSAPSPREQATALMLLVKQGKLTPEEADSKIQRLVGSGGRRTIRRPVGPE